MYIGTIAEFLNMGGGEIVLIMAAVLLLFGGKKLPELARGLGKGIRDFKDASEGVKREIHRNINAMDIDDELKADGTYASTTPTKSATQTLEEQMYPKSELNDEVPAKLDQIDVKLDQEDLGINTEDQNPQHSHVGQVHNNISEVSVDEEKLETEKNKLN